MLAHRRGRRKGEQAPVGDRCLFFWGLEQYIKGICAIGDCTNLWKA